MEKLTNGEIIKLYESLQAVNYPGFRFAYAVGRNIAILKPHVLELIKAQEPSEAWKKYDEEREELAKKFAQKDARGNPIILDKRYVFENAQVEKELDKEVEKLKAVGDNQKIFDAHKKLYKDFQELLKKEKEIKLYKVKLDELPKEITSQHASSIFPIIEE